MKTLIMGIGNILQKDDGVGVYVIEALMKDNTITGLADLLDGGTAGYDLVPIMKDYNRIIVVDALKADDIPGSVYHFGGEHLAGGTMVNSLHEFGVKAILNMLKMMGVKPEVEIVGVVPEDHSTLEIGLTGPVEKAIPKVIEIIKKTISHEMPPKTAAAQAIS